MADNTVDLAHTLRWRLLRRLLPRRYRESWGDALLEAHRERRNACGYGAFRFWRLLVFDVVLTSGRVWLDRVDDAITSTGRVHIMDTLGYNLRLAARGLARSPGFTIAVVLTLGLGLGANATLFTVIDRLLLRAPERVVNPDQVRRLAVRGASEFTKEIRYSRALSYPDYREFGKVSGFSSVAAYTGRNLTLGRGLESERIAVELATASYFPLLGVRPAAGRFYSEAEDRIASDAPAVVLGWGFWQRRFGGSHSILGKQLEIGKGHYTVIGVAPRGFTGVDISPIDVWLPLHTAQAIENGTGWENARTWYWFAALARLNPNVSETGIFAEATTRYQAGRAEFAAGGQATSSFNNPDAEVVGTSLIAARGPDPSREARVAQALGAVALLVLVIACANVCNLFLARGIQRRPLLAVQSALGVGRARLFLQLLAEAILLSIAAGAFALAFAEAIAPVLFRTLLPNTAPPATSSIRVMLFTTMLAATTIVLAALIPALRASRVQPGEVLRATRVSARSSWLRRGLLATQAALSIVLLIAAGLFLRSLQEARNIDLGPDLDTVFLDIELDGGTRSGEALAAASRSLLEHLRAHPAVASATITNVPPFSGIWGLGFALPAPDTIPTGFPPSYYSADEDYFRTLGFALRLGRTFAAGDNSEAAAPVAIVNGEFARRFWGDEKAGIGKCLLFGRNPADAPCTTVVGLVEDIVPSINAQEPMAAYYLPTNHPGGMGGEQVMIRLRGGMESQLAFIQQFARNAVPGIRYIEAISLRDRIAPQLRAWEMGAVLLTAFGLLALVVAAAGLYSVLAFDVAQRRFELGVRAALGAPARSLIGVLIRETGPVIAFGVAIGIIGTVLLARNSVELLFRVEPVDPIIYGAAVTVLAFVATTAALLPASRALRADPRDALIADR